MQLVQVSSQDEDCIRDGTEEIEAMQIAEILWLEQSLEILTHYFSFYHRKLNVKHTGKGCF